MSTALVRMEGRELTSDVVLAVYFEFESDSFILTDEIRQSSLGESLIDSVSNEPLKQTRQRTHDSHLEITRHSPLQLLRRGVDLLRFFSLDSSGLLRRASRPRGRLGFEEGGGCGVDRLGETKNQFGVDVRDVSVVDPRQRSTIPQRRVRLTEEQCVRRLQNAQS